MNRRRLRLDYGRTCRFLDPHDAAELAGVSVQTVYKWINGTHPIEPRTKQILHLRAFGLLPSPVWKDWHLDEQGKLIAPNGFSFWPGELEALSLLKQLNGELQATVARLTVENREQAQALAHLRRESPRANVVRFKPRRQRDTLAHVKTPPA
jgi:hypothetical protein